MGEEAILKKAETHLKNGEYVKALHLTDVILIPDPDHQEANRLRLKTLEAMKTGPYNYIEFIWLDYGINQIKKKLNIKE
jgi:hypothetical protein